MLKSLQLKGTAAFGTEEVSVGPLAPVTFIFGPNGSGKTTISRAFADPARFAGSELIWDQQTRPDDIKVYNRDYVNNTLKQAANLPGVFKLGPTSAEKQAEIDELGGPSGTIALAKNRIEHLRNTLAKIQKDATAGREELKKAAWTKRSEVPSELRKMFDGYNNNRENLLNKLLEVARAYDTSVEDFDALIPEAAAVLADDAVQLLEIPRVSHLRLEDEAGFELLEIPVVGSGDVRLASLIQQLQNADWVEHGRHYLERTGETCPFCQQTVPTDLVEQLDAYFDTRYSHQIAQLKALQQQVESWIASCHVYFDDVLSRTGVADHLNVESFQSARLELEQALEHLASMLSLKIDGPSAVVKVVYPKAEVDTINDIVNEGNASIETFNLRLQNRATAKEALLLRSWIVFARRTLATEVGRFEGAMPAVTKGQEKLRASIIETEHSLREKIARLRELQGQVTSNKPIIQTINRLLESVGFHSFRLAQSSAAQDGYSLIRENGEIAAETLSEGEQTFITFLYFAQSLQGTPKDGSETDDLVAVIDDPISSLDSDVLYAVSTLVRRIVADISSNKGRVRQLVLLTHNAHFHKEVTYRAQGEKNSGWQYGVVRKRGGQPSEVILGKVNPIQTAYAALWEEVKRASREPAASAAGVQNILRRILETYFKVLGGVDNTEIIAKFTNEDQIICRTLFSWVNAGSHSIFDDLDYSPTPTTVETNLRIFRQIFKEQGQEGHYLMMMGELADSPVAGATLASSQPADTPGGDSKEEDTPSGLVA